MDVDDTGNPHVIYYWWTSTSQGLTYARWTGSDWESDATVPRLGNTYLGWTFALDSGAPAILQCDFGTSGWPVVLTTRTGTGWVTDTVSGGERCVGGVGLFFDAAGRMHAFAQTGGGGRDRLSHFRRETSGAWTTLPSPFSFDSDLYTAGGMDVTQAPDGAFHAVTGRTTDGGGPSMPQVFYAHESTPGGWPRELIYAVTPHEPKFVAVDTGGIAHVAHGSQGVWLTRTPPWTAGSSRYFIEGADTSSVGVEIEPDLAGGLIAMYGGSDQYVMRQRSSDGSSTTLVRLPSIGFANSYTSYDLHLYGSTAHAVYTALECSTPACTSGTPRIHYAQTPF